MIGEATSARAVPTVGVAVVEPPGLGDDAALEETEEANVRRQPRRTPGVLLGQLEAHLGAKIAATTSTWVGGRSARGSEDGSVGP